MSFYSRALRPALFTLEAERAHDLTLASLRQPLVVGALRAARRERADPRLRTRVLGLDLVHPLGLAAGLDKQGTATAAWDALGFAFAEIGTVTPRPQPGNPRPRLFRLPADRAIINRFGFNSAGADRVAAHLRRGVPAGLRLGINVGKNKETPNERAADDYLTVVDTLHPMADYFVVNVSSPNTAGLRDLQESRSLRTLVEQVRRRVGEVAGATPPPVLVKVSPDADESDLLRSVDAAVEGGAAGIVATNTTIARTGLRTPPPRSTEVGGLSGAPLTDAAHAACRRLFAHLGRHVPIVGVGGILTADDAYARVRAGASLLQVYTGLIYEGPGLVSRIVRGLSERLAADGFSSVEEAIGIDVR